MSPSHDQTPGHGPATKGAAHDPGGLHTVTIDEMIDAHCRYLAARGRRARTIGSRRDALRRVQKVTGRSLADLTREELQTYIDGLLEPATKRVYLAHIRGFYLWAVDEEVLGVDITRRVHAPKLPKQIPHPMDEADLVRVLTDAQPDVRAWILLAAEAGLRACEIALIRGEHVREYPTPILYLPETKGGGEDTVPLSDDLLAELRRWPRTGPLWGPTEVHYQTVSRKVARHLRKHGIPEGVRLHALRHRFATMVYATNGHDLRQTQELLRHASPATTAVYAAIDPVGPRRTVNALPRIA